MSLCLTELVEMDRDSGLVDLSNGPAGGREALLIDIMPVVGGTGDGFLDCSYRLGCELPVLYGLVPELDVSITCWGRSSVVWGAMVGGEVGAIRNGNIVPELVGANWGCEWWSTVIPTGYIIPSMVVRVIAGGDGSDVTAHIESPAVADVAGIFPRRWRSRGIWGRVSRTGGGEDDDRCAPSGRSRRPSLWDDRRSQLRSDLLSF